MRKWLGLVAGLAAVIALPAMAQMSMVHVRGVVQSIDGSTLVVAPKSGDPITLKLADNWGVSMVKPVDISAIQPGSFIGTTEVDKPDGTGQSLEVHVFPPGVKMGEGHYDWDLQPHSMMTNGTVGTVVASPDGKQIDVAYPNGTRHILVPGNVPIVGFTLADKSMIKPGVAVFIIAAKQPDGSLATNRITIGENGAAPPM